VSEERVWTVDDLTEAERRFIEEAEARAAAAERSGRRPFAAGTMADKMSDPPGLGPGGRLNITPPPKR